MSKGWKVVVAEVGKRLLQVIAVVIAEEIIRRSLTTAFKDNDIIYYEKSKKKILDIKE
jgi:uncharacterized membrane protein YgcG